MAESEVDSRGLVAGESRESSGPKITRLIKLTSIAGILIILALLAAAMVAALTAAETWAPLIQIFRDILLLILILEAVLVITAFAILMLQAAGFLIMLKTEVKPILDNARETTRLSKATAQFINSNAVDPLIQIKSFLTGLLAFLRELIRIHNLVTVDEGRGDQSDERQTP
ncbi:MAG: hypothetical protein OXI34_07110 [Chloroflexota bacterium]|nr:hypothetical protein [Chloroflexota bacterium]MDE2946382.1 hypothetical protein [Chloroflexota bacterium]